jgi:4-amino-4-deoxy-L-arabinose transferase-like glycosyltransferase
LIAGFLLLFRLGSYPAPWYDEGSHLHVAKNLALNGVYADFSSEGNRYYGPVLGVGPTVLLPIALVFKLLGVSITYARLVIVAYGVLALIAFYLLGTQVMSRRGAYIALVLMVLSPGVDFVFNTRTVLGEVPGLAFLTAGLWLWLRPGPRSLLELVGVGVLMGLTAITKNQFAITVLPALFVTWIADLVWYRQRGWRYFVIPGVIAGLIFGLWLLALLTVLGESRQISENLAAIREASSGAFLILRFDTMYRAFQNLIERGVYGGLFIPIVIYGLVISLKRTADGQRFGTILIFILASIGLYISALPWPRYAFPALVFSALFLVHFLERLTDGFRLDWRGLRAATPPLSSLVTILVIGWVVLLILVPGYRQVNELRTKARSDAYQVAGYLQANVAKEAVIETWEQELAVLSNHRFHYPPQIVLAKAVANQWLGAPLASEFYDFRTFGQPEYVIVGPFAQYTFLYPQDRLTEYTRLTTIGAYEIYQRRGS